MALSSKRIQILGLAMILIACAATAFGQDYWSVQKPMSCHPKLLSSVHDGLFLPVVKQYSWTARVTNTYDQTVTFDMYMKVGNQKQSIGQFTVAPGKSTNAASVYYDDPSKLVEISVDHVCFLKGGCKVSCYAGCDNGLSINQPSCEDQPNNPPPNQNQNSTNNTGNANSSEAIKQRKDSNNQNTNNCQNEGEKGSAIVEDLRRKILLNLKANIRNVAFELPDGSYVTIFSPEISSSGNSLTIKFGQTRGFREVGYWGQDLIQTTSFSGLAASMKALPPGSAENNLRFINRLTFQWLAVDAQRETRNFKPYLRSSKEAAVYGLPYDMGPADANYNELVKLLAQLKSQGVNTGGSITPCKPDQNVSLATTTTPANNAEAIKQKIVENIRTNIQTGKFHDDYSNTDVTISNLSVQTQGDSILIMFHERSQELGHRSWSWQEWDISVKSLISELPNSKIVPNRYPSQGKKGYGFFYGDQTSCRVRMTASWAGRVDPETDACGLADILYDPGSNNQNFNELKALAAQLAGSPVANTGNSTGNNATNNTLPNNSRQEPTNNVAPIQEPGQKSAEQVVIDTYREAERQRLNNKDYDAVVEKFENALKLDPIPATLDNSGGKAINAIRNAYYEMRMSVRNVIEGYEKVTKTERAKKVAIYVRALEGEIKWEKRQLELYVEPPTDPEKKKRFYIERDISYCALVNKYGDLSNYKSIKSSLADVEAANSMCQSSSYPSLQWKGSAEFTMKNIRAAYPKKKGSR